MMSLGMDACGGMNDPQTKPAPGAQEEPGYVAPQYVSFLADGLTFIEYHRQVEAHLVSLLSGRPSTSLEAFVGVPDAHSPERQDELRRTADRMFRTQVREEFPRTARYAAIVALMGMVE